MRELLTCSMVSCRIQAATLGDHGLLARIAWLNQQIAAILQLTEELRERTEILLSPPRKEAPWPTRDRPIESFYDLDESSDDSSADEKGVDDEKPEDEDSDERMQDIASSGREEKEEEKEDDADQDDPDTEDEDEYEEQLDREELIQLLEMPDTALQFSRGQLIELRSDDWAVEDFHAYYPFKERIAYILRKTQASTTRTRSSKSSFSTTTRSRAWCRTPWSSSQSSSRNGWTRNWPSCFQCRWTSCSTWTTVPGRTR